MMSIYLEAMLGRLRRIRKAITAAQDEKLISKWETHGDYKDWDLSTIIDKLIEEMIELDEAIQQKGPDDIKEEILDVRNVTEFLWDKLSKRKIE